MPRDHTVGMTLPYPRKQACVTDMLDNIVRAMRPQPLPRAARWRAAGGGRRAAWPPGPWSFS